MDAYTYSRGRKWIRAALTDSSGAVDPFGAVVFGKLYEELLRYYFKSQRNAARTSRTWRDAGQAWVQETQGGRRIPQDFLVETLLKNGNGPSGGQLVCFEAKSWPGYRDFDTLRASNIETFLDAASRFLSYLERPARSWWVEFPGCARERRKPDAFGFLVFDYATKDRPRIVAAMRRRHPRLLYVESIVSRLSMIIYNGGVKAPAIRSELRRAKRIADRLCGLFLNGQP
jgi:hypothetical protein